MTERSRDPRVDAYIARSAPFARPILKHIREVVHESCPEVAETIKWSSPSFEYRGILCGFAAFKGHCAFGFWKHALLGVEDGRSGEAMGSFGRITSLGDLPPKATLRRYIREAMRLNEEGVKAPREKTRPRRPARMHPDLKRAMAASRKATATFEAFPPSQKREYVEWVAEAKGDDTRARRVAQAIEWMAEGKPRNWKYMRRQAR